MDILAHAIYGATICSRTGLAGGRRRPPEGRRRPWVSDWTVWCSALFGALPDAVSLGPPMLAFWLSGAPGNFFRHLDGDALVPYRCTHSLIVALGVSGVLRLGCRPLFIPSLAWALHVFMDALTHGAGKFQTTVFYPLSTWGFDGIRWWEHPGLVQAYWIFLPAMWFGIWAWRRPERHKDPA